MKDDVLPDLQHLIQLQTLELSAEDMRRRIAEAPEARAALDQRLAERSAALAALKERLAANQAARRDIEKDLAVVQGRLSRYKDQLMEVKTNKEYQAMQTEITVTEGQVRGHEDRLLERMVETETLSAELKAAEAALRREEADVVRERSAFEADLVRLQQELERAAVERQRIGSALSPHALTIFQHISSRRRGIALSEARDGHCLQCHVRLRPQVFNEVRRNDSLIQCDSCSRLLYFVPAAAAGAAPHAS